MMKQKMPPFRRKKSGKSFPVKVCTLDAELEFNLEVSHLYYFYCYIITTTTCLLLLVYNLFLSGGRQAEIFLISYVGPSDSEKRTTSDCNLRTPKGLYHGSKWTRKVISFSIFFEETWDLKFACFFIINITKSFFLQYKTSAL